MARCRRCAEGVACAFKHGLGGYTNHGCKCEVCKSAMAARDAKYRAENRERNAQYQAKYYALNRDAITERVAQYRRTNRPVVVKQRARYQDANREKISQYHSEWYTRNRESIAARNARYYANNRDQAAYRGARRYARIRGATASDRNGARWTAAEDFVVQRSDITLVEMSHMLQRTFSAVAARRRRIGAKAR